jgi:hypothetical protein
LHQDNLDLPNALEKFQSVAMSAKNDTSIKKCLRHSFKKLPRPGVDALNPGIFEPEQKEHIKSLANKIRAAVGVKSLFRET